VKTSVTKNLLDVAREYLSRGWAPIPVPIRSKRPILMSWPSLRLTEEALVAHFDAGPSNIGLLLGEPSGGLIDIDLDAPEAVALASAFLPTTGMVHGRPSKRRSHYWFRTQPAPKTLKFADPDGTCLAEIRSTGGQTVVPPSTHVGGEAITWDAEGDPTTVDADELRSRVGALAACALLSRRWNGNIRHDLALSVSGGLLRSGWTLERTKQFIGLAALAAKDEEASHRTRDVQDTAAKIDAGQEATGWPRVAELLGAEVVARLKDFLEIRTLSQPSQTLRSADAPWPKPLADEAMHGIAGEVVRAIEPHSEADRVALLVQFLSAFGAAVGSGPHTWASDARHTLRLWANLVGKTSKGRKGSAWAPIRRLFSRSDPSIVGDRLVHGLSSGEGVIWAVRDQIEKYERSGRGTDRTSRLEIVDPGIADKRLLVLEEEFASVLQVVKREGNTLSAMVRCAWDHGNLQALTKNSPAKATGAHVVILGHISRDELLRHLDQTEVASGFANRFIWLCARRARELPEGSNLPDAVLERLARGIASALEAARKIDLMERDPAAKKIWAEIYGPLSAERPGLAGVVTARAEAQVLRLSMTYAALDGSHLIRPEHLLAALAIWTYSDHSVTWIFGDSLGDPLADEILRALRREGPLPRNDIYLRWGRHRGAARVDLALGLLLEYGKARFERRVTGGRPIELWCAQ
jgi:Bifunctional DNA primase/polymerase, N-terminal